VSPSFAGDLIRGSFREPTVSADGAFVAFAARADGLTPVGLPDTWNTYIHEVARHLTTIASVSHSDQAATTGTGLSPAISSDGHQIVFSSSSTNLVPALTAGVNAYRRSR
jgi:Tol biopolymer transport system component